MFCNECGAKNPDNAKFCNNCGAKLVASAPVANKANIETTVISNPNEMPPTQVAYHDPINVSKEEIGKLFDKDTAKAFMEEQDSRWHKETKEEAAAYEKAYKEQNTSEANRPLEEANPTLVTALAEEYNDDMDDEVSEPKEVPSVEQALAALSTSKNKVNPVELTRDKTKSELPLIDDHYFDDVLPEIDNEIYSIPKGNIWKIVFSIIGLFIIMAWLIYWMS